MNISPRDIKKIAAAIRRILLQDWDPLGVYGAGPDDEYDSCIWPLMKILREGRGEGALADCLLEMEEDLTGTAATTRKEARAIAAKLAALEAAKTY